MNLVLSIVTFYAFQTNLSWSAFAFVQVPSAFRGKGDQTSLTSDQTVLNSFSYQNGDLSRGADYSYQASSMTSSSPNAPPVTDEMGIPVPSLKTTDEIWPSLSIVHVQGSSLRTCAFDESVERMQVLLRTEGRPLNANVELWQGPDNAPQRIQVYLEDGSLRPFRTVIEYTIL